MKINLNIIKVFLFFLVVTSAPAVWLPDRCQAVDCAGCKEIKDDIEDAAENIYDKYIDLEDNIAEKYEKYILNANIKKIDKIQVGITKSVARINAMEHEANMDSKKLIFLLRKNKDLYTLPLGSR